MITGAVDDCLGCAVGEGEGGESTLSRGKAGAGALFARPEEGTIRGVRL